ncbi:MAG TPA: hypothetical protein VMP31_12630 [Pseudomonas sp.]|nr:hypothetical protein [Pseudomonas sp.]HUE92946.1 hypothetical protein [Pseudomonas sp.]
MKTYLSLLLVAMLAVSVQGCSLRLPGIGVDIGDGGGGGGGPSHCPPGQAKKGRC